MVEAKAGKYRDRGATGLQPLGEAFLAMLDRDQRRLMRLCAALEKLADGLPQSCASPKTARLLAFMDSAYDRHIFLHEKCLFPLVRSLAGTRAGIEPILAQLEYEHASDHGSVHEITSAFLNGPSGEAKPDACVLGFSLRSFFENCRRHRAWETNILYPIAQDLLVDGAAAARHGALLRMSLGFGV
ncbi:MAG: hemerythrin domain-containing protein [Rhodomicrobium sp.]